MSTSALEMTGSQPRLVLLSPPLRKCAVNPRLLEISVVWQPPWYCFQISDNVPLQPAARCWSFVGGCKFRSRWTEWHVERWPPRCHKAWFGETHMRSSGSSSLERNLPPLINLMTQEADSGASHCRRYSGLINLITGPRRASEAPDWPSQTLLVTVVSLARR